jgi:hypothetical protein
MATTQKQIDRYRAANAEAARIIVADPVKYVPGSLPAIWAAIVLNPPGKWTAPTTWRAA